MFNKKTLFILGAGASQEVGLPTGYGLKKVIGSLLDVHSPTTFSIAGTDGYLINILKTHAMNDFTKLRNSMNAARKINASIDQAVSIDNYIDHHSHDPDIQFCGKIAIVRAILEAERSSSLFISNDNMYNTLPFTSLESTWFHKFFQLLTTGLRKNDIDKLFDNISVITFNYDRCLEHYLLHALKNFSHISDDEAIAILKTLDILHPYGLVGTLPWLDTANDFSSIFGAEASSINATKFISISKQIKTFTEQEHDKDVLVRIHEAMSTAQKIVFLGFGFNAENMELLNPSKQCLAQNIFATFKGIPEGDVDAVKKLIYKTLGHDKQSSKLVNIYPLHDTCCGLMNYYERSISG